MNAELANRAVLAEMFFATIRAKAAKGGKRNVVEMMQTDRSDEELGSRPFESTVHARCLPCGTMTEIVYRADPPPGGWKRGCGVEAEQISYSGCGC